MYHQLTHSSLISFVLFTMNCLMANQEVICLYLSSGVNPFIPILSKTIAINRLTSWLFQKNLQQGNSFSLTHLWTYAPVVKGSSLDTGKSASDTCGHSCGYHYNDLNSNLLDLPNVQLLAMLPPPHQWHFQWVLDFFLEGTSKSLCVQLGSNCLGLLSSLLS